MKEYKKVCKAEKTLPANENPPCSQEGFKSGIITVVDLITQTKNRTSFANLTDDEFIDTFKNLMRNASLWDNLQPFFDKHLSIANFTITYAHSLIHFGAPLNINGVRYDNRSHNQ